MKRKYSSPSLAMGIALTLVASPIVQAATEHPNRPIKFVVPFSPEAATDQFARAIASSFTKDTGQPVVVENKPGANGFLAAVAVKTALPDGYVIFFTSNTTQVATSNLFKTLPYDPVKDFTPLVLLGKGPNVFVVNANSPIKSVDNLVAAAKSKPGQLSFGPGSASSRVSVALQE